MVNGGRYDGKVLYRGEWAGDRAHGKGEVFWGNGQLRYQGEFKDGFKHGNGTLFTADGKQDYVGAFAEDKRAEGKSTAADGAQIEQKAPVQKPGQKVDIAADAKDQTKDGKKTKDACCTTF